MIRSGGAGPVQEVDFRGAKHARPTPEVTNAIATARAIVIGPSNPIISIGPILAVPGIRAALANSAAPKVAVSPLVAGAVVKGPTAAFMEWTGLPLNSDGIAAYYEGVIDGLVADQRAQRVPVLETDVMMDSPAARRRVADNTLRFALALG
jgi:LPPG:FO 2-phospho-L-lactate transferase